MTLYETKQQEALTFARIEALRKTDKMEGAYCSAYYDFLKGKRDAPMSMDYGITPARAEQLRREIVWGLAPDKFWNEAH